jgi:uncharacterized protein DUF6152
MKNHRSTWSALMCRNKAKAMTNTTAVVLGIVLCSAAVEAHHSFAAQFDPTKPMTINGSVTKVEWTNPHIYVYVDVKEPAGTVVNWAIEMGNPLQLVRLGWTRNDVKVGDSVTVDGWLARDGTKLINAKSVLLGGRKMFAGSSQNTTP